MKIKVVEKGKTKLWLVLPTAILKCKFWVKNLTENQGSKVKFKKSQLQNLLAAQKSIYRALIEYRKKYGKLTLIEAQTKEKTQVLIKI